MLACTSPNRLFTLLSCVAVVGAVVTVSQGALAACPEADPGPLPYKNAKTPTSACTPADITFIQTEANKAGTTFQSLEASLTAKNAACSTCVFSKEADAAWGPLVYVGTEGGAFVNYGSCYEKAAGGNPACGQSITKFDLCTAVRCPVNAASCQDQAAANTCVQSVAGNASSCGQYNFVDDCPNLTQLDQSCGNLLSVITVMCGAPAPSNPDAGTSSSGGNSSGGNSSGSSGGEDEDTDKDTDKDKDEDEGDSSGSSGSSGGKKGSSTSSSGATVTPQPAPITTVEGCAQGSSSAGGSIASGLVIAAAVGAAVSRRRRKR